jgi:hypothetical protein
MLNFVNYYTFSVNKSMACAACKELDIYPDYLKAILKEINAGNDDNLKSCTCQLRSYIDKNKKAYVLPLCISSMNGTDNQLYTALTQAAPNGIIREVDPQKIMELQFKYKELKTNVFGKGEGDFGASCSDEGNDNPYTGFSELITFNKSDLTKLQQVCDIFGFYASTTKFGFYSNCDNEDAGVYPFLFEATLNPGSASFLFFDQKYQTPEKDQPGPILYQWYLPLENSKYSLANGFIFNGGNTCSSGGQYDACAEAADISEYIEWK